MLSDVFEPQMLPAAPNMVSKGLHTEAPSSSSSTGNSRSSSDAYVAQDHFHCKIGMGVDTSDRFIGCAYVEQGSSKVTAYLLPPRPAGQGKGTPSASFEQGIFDTCVSFASHLSDKDIFEPLQGRESDEDLHNIAATRLSRAIASAITPALLLKSYPKTVLSVHILVMESSPFDMAAAINAASLALCDGAVEARDLVTAASMYCSSPTLTTTIACLSSLDEITHLDILGQSSSTDILNITSAGSKKCAQIRQEIVTRIRDGLSQR